MQEHDLSLPRALRQDRVGPLVDRLAVQEGLQITLKTELKKYPGCTHWHFKKAAETGILEVTWWPEDQKNPTPRLWLSVHGNRRSDWIDDALPRLALYLESHLHP